MNARNLIGRGLVLRWLLAALLMAATAPAWAAAPAGDPASPNAPGDLDPSFGGFVGGNIVVDSSYAGHAMAVQPDGKLVMAGRVTATVLEVRRYLTDGKLDLTFGAGGLAKVPAPIGMEALIASDVALQADGAIVVVGRNTSSEDNSGANFVLLRLTAAGQLDTSFNNSGFVLTDFSNQRDLASEVLIQPNGKIVVAGMARIGSKDDFAVARYHPNGALDDNSDGDGGFGSGGRVTVNFQGSDNANALALLPDGRLVVVGGAVIGQDYDFAVIRLEADGTLDDNSDGDGGFSGDGKLTTGFGANEEALAVALQADGRLVVAGQANVLSADNSFVARFKPNGDLDGTFGSGGKLTLPNDKLSRLALMADGRLVLFGEHPVPDGITRFVLYRLNSNGSLDATFGEGTGIASHHMGDKFTAKDLALLADGRLVVLGLNVNEMMLTRLWPDGMTRDTRGQQIHGLGFPPKHQPGHHELVGGLAVQPDGRFLVAGQLYEPGFTFSDAFVTRFLPNGQPDATFGGSGSARVTGGVYSAARAVAVQPDGKAVLAGYSAFNAEYTIADFLVARFNAYGLPDTGFGLNGVSHVDFEGGPDLATALAVAADGKLVVGGTIWNGVRSDWGVARLTAAGQPDPTFDFDGEAYFGLGLGNSLNAVATLPDGKILVAGQIGGDFAIARLLANGFLDSTFGTSGFSLTDLGGTDVINALRVAPNGWIYAGGYRNINGNADLALVQYTPDGRVEPCFDQGNCNRWSTGMYFMDAGPGDYAHALDLRGENELVAAGCSGEHFAAVQLRTDAEPVALPFSTDFAGYPDCAKGVKFVGNNNLLMVGDQSHYPFNGDSNVALARFYTTSYEPSGVQPRIFIPLILR